MKRVFPMAVLLATPIVVTPLLAGSAPAIAAPAAPASNPAAVARLFVQFLLPASVEYSAGDWDMVRAVRAVRWSKGPILLDKPTPEGAFFALPGQIAIGGRQAVVVANGARTMVFNYYLLDPAPPGNPEAAAAGFKAAGYTLAPARCPIGGRDYPDSRRWYRITYPGKRPAYLYTTTIKTGGSGYVLYIGGLPTMSERDAPLFTDDCANAAATPQGFRTGTEAVVALFDQLIRPTSAAASLPWPTVKKLPSITWRKGPDHVTIPYSGGGDDPNPYTLSGTIKTPTTESETRATGTAGAATRFYFRYLDHIRPGEVFDRLRGKGYRITAIRCGKAYTKMSENWFSITAPGKRPAILYRAFSNDLGPTKVSFVLRIDNVMPPIAQGQRAAPPSGCPG
jgi:hypothetical protein